MYRGYSNLYSSAAISAGLRSIAKIASVFAVGVIASGCVATALTPSAVLPSPELSTNLSLTEQDPNAIPAADDATSTADQPEAAVAANGVTVPVRRPGSAAAAQLALADTSSTSVAAQKAEKIALTNGGKNPAAKVADAQHNAAPDGTLAAKSEPPIVAAPKKPASKGFFASLFQSTQIKRPKRSITNTARSKPATKNNRKVAVFRPVTKGALPGVRKLGLFGIYDAREGANEGYSDDRLASIGGLARTSPNGLRIQRSGVQVACLRPGLVRLIKQVQRRYGRVPVVTSGYRNPSSNRRAGGARNSMHIYCKAADIQVSGVSKWALAKYLRTLPGRGGVGTYCHTKSVHIDIGSKRDWNWRCRRGTRSKKTRLRRKSSG